VNIQYFSDTFDNKVSPDLADAIEWQDLVRLLGQHESYPSKELTGGFVLAEFDMAGARLETGEVRRVGENIAAYHGIVLDYDGGPTVGEIRELFEGLEHCGYTSWSHRSKPGDRFRVVVPFDRPCPRAEWERRRAAIRECFYFGHESLRPDSGSLALGRIFYLPSCPPERRDDAEAWHERGERFRWDVLDVTLEHVPVPPVPAARRIATGHGRVLFETFDMPRFFKDEGLWVRQVSEDKHDVMCPRVGGHHDGGTYIRYERDRLDGKEKWRFHCSHDKCRGFSFTGHFNNKYGNAFRVPYCEREVSRHDEYKRALAKILKKV
jgi:hypothetical protein